MLPLAPDLLILMSLALRSPYSSMIPKICLMSVIPLSQSWSCFSLSFSSRLTICKNILSCDLIPALQSSQPSPLQSTVLSLPDPSTSSLCTSYTSRSYLGDPSGSVPIAPLCNILTVAESPSSFSENQPAFENPCPSYLLINSPNDFPIVPVSSCFCFFLYLQCHSL